MNRTSRTITIAAITAGLALTACGPGRTSAYTQATPAAFDAAQSDAKAVELVDKMVTSLGGADKWVTVKQISWKVGVMIEGQPRGAFNHAWDRWNARHRFQEIDLASMAKAKAEGDPSLIRSLTVMYKLYERDRAHATFGDVLPRSEARKYAERAYTRWQEDAYRLAFAYKMKDPGTILKHKGQASPVKGKCDPGCEVVEVTFADGVGTDIYLVQFNQTTGLPDILEKKVGETSVGYAIDEWTEVNGLKFPTKFTNLGMDTEKVAHTDISIGDPNDSLYIPQVR